MLYPPWFSSSPTPEITRTRSVTVLDTDHDRGIVTILLTSLVDEAVANGITSPGPTGAGLPGGLARLG